MIPKRDKYFEWLIDSISNSTYDPEDYSKVLIELYNTEYLPLDPFDDSRVEDAISMREYNGYGAQSKWGANVLEVLIALARRGEDQIMWDPDKEDRSGVWFWAILKNMHLTEYPDIEYDENAVRIIVDKFIFKEYEADGTDGPFYIPNATRDVRIMDLWTQMNWYFTNLLETEE